MSINYHQHGLTMFRHLYNTSEDDYEQLRQLSTMVLGATFMLDQDSQDAAELQAFRVKVNTRISELLGLNDYASSDALLRKQTLARAEAAKPLLPRNGSAAMRI